MQLAKVIVSDFEDTTLISPNYVIDTAAASDLAWPIRTVSRDPLLIVDVVLSPEEPIGRAYILRWGFTSRGLREFSLPGSPTLFIHCDSVPIELNHIGEIGVLAARHQQLRRRHGLIVELCKTIREALRYYRSGNQQMYITQLDWRNIREISGYGPYISDWVITAGAKGLTQVEAQYRGDSISYELRIIDENTGDTFAFESRTEQVIPSFQEASRYKYPNADDKTLALIRSFQDGRRNVLGIVPPSRYSSSLFQPHY